MLDLEEGLQGASASRPGLRRPVASLTRRGLFSREMWLQKSFNRRERLPGPLSPFLRGGRTVSCFHSTFLSPQAEVSSPEAAESSENQERQGVGGWRQGCPE